MRERLREHKHWQGEEILGARDMGILVQSTDQVQLSAQTRCRHW